VNKQIVSKAAKRILTRSGSLLSTPAVHAIRVAAGYVSVGHWVKERGYSNAPRVASRNRVFDAMLHVIGNDPVAYLEFGVFEGASLKYWSARLTNQESELHGFDSFKGLPETFDSDHPMGLFDLGGEPPHIKDPRVSFHVGWFEATVPGFAVPGNKRLVITLDADLYSSTILVLDSLDRYIVEGTLIYFDELSRIEHEPAAFDDYIHRTGKRFSAVALESTLNTGAFVCVDSGLSGAANAAIATTGDMPIGGSH
jgi:Macrocin-O-methyltransferase (TylF)